MDYPDPCDSCKKSEKCTNGCSDWKIRYRHRQKQINIYAHRNRYKMPKYREVFIYEHPDEIRRYLKNGPCVHCKAKETCDIPCSIYWRWWDARMEWLKGVWGL